MSSSTEVGSVLDSLTIRNMTLFQPCSHIPLPSRPPMTSFNERWMLPSGSPKSAIAPRLIPPSWSIPPPPPPPPNFLNLPWSQRPLPFRISRYLLDSRLSLRTHLFSHSCINRLCCGWHCLSNSHHQYPYLALFYASFG